MWNFPLVPDSASSYSGQVDAIMLYELGVLLFFTGLILFLILFFAVRYRRGSRVDRTDPPESSLALEAAWIGVPLALALVMFAWGTYLYFVAYEPPGDASKVYVVGKQWMWYVMHPEGKKEINELHLPVGRPVQLVMSSQDVIHSFYVPAFRVKQDVLPGRSTTMWFHPTRPGTYHLFCAEYCGTNHSAMGGWVYVMDPAEYERWLGADRVSSMAREGEALFVRHHCSGCHGASPIVNAPRLEGVYGHTVPIQEGRGADAQVHFVLADERYIRDSILLPKQQVVAGYDPVMPSYDGQIEEEDLLKIIEYIKSIGGKGASR